MTDDIDELVEWQLNDSPAALKHRPRKLHGSASSMPGLALPANLYAPDATRNTNNGSGE